MRKLVVCKLERERKSRDGKGRMSEEIWREGELVRRGREGREEGRTFWEVPSEKGEMKMSDV
jgi:hypothetical protein